MTAFRLTYREKPEVQLLIRGAAFSCAGLITGPAAVCWLIDKASVRDFDNSEPSLEVPLLLTEQ